MQNVGAYGVEVADVIRRVRLLDRRTGDVRWVAPERWVRLPHQHIEELGGSGGARGGVRPRRRRAQRAAAVRRAGECAGREPDAGSSHPRARGGAGLRARKGMVLDETDHDTWSVGSFFTNPVVRSAEFDRVRAGVDGPVPNYPAPEGVKLAAGWLVEQRRLRRRDTPATTPRRGCPPSTRWPSPTAARATTADVLRWPGRSARV